MGETYSGVQNDSIEIIIDQRKNFSFEVYEVICVDFTSFPYLGGKKNEEI